MQNKSKTKAKKHSTGLSAACAFYNARASNEEFYNTQAAYAARCAQLAQTHKCVARVGATRKVYSNTTSIVLVVLNNCTSEALRASVAQALQAHIAYCNAKNFTAHSTRALYLRNFAAQIMQNTCVCAACKALQAHVDKL